MSLHPLFRVAALAVALLGTSAGLHADNPGRDHGRRHDGVAFTMTNAADGNRILVFDREPDGDLDLVDSFPTGGLGTGAGLGNQSGLFLTRDGNWLLAVNAGSGELSLFEVADDVLILRDVVASGGFLPLSIAVDHHLVYVVNGGDGSGEADNISGFVLHADTGRLSAIPGSTRMLSSPNAGPAQISFNPSGGVLVVTEKATNKITTFTVGDDGTPAAAIVQDSSGSTPFGFAFDRRGRLYVSEAFGGAPNVSALSSYALDDSGLLTPITASLSTLQTAACWVALDGTGRHVYTTNAGSSSITGFHIAPNGALSRLDAGGVTASTGIGSAPIDMALSRDGRFLYALSSGSNTISGYRVHGDGSLELIDRRGGVPAGASGLVVR